MKENIETKDVQKTEYLDKNGLDMLWAKVKENTHNQVEVERNRAVAKENSIADTKADKSALGEYIKIASNTETKVNGVIRTVDVINNNIGFGDNESSLAYIGKGEIGIASYKNGYAMESFRYTTSYGLVTTNISGYKNIAIPCDRNVIKIYEYNSEAHNTNYGYNGVVLGENNDDSNLLNTNGSYKTIGTDITPLENGKVPAEYLDLSQYAKKSEITAGGNVDDVQVNGVSVIENKIANIKPATKENLGVVKVGDGLNVNPFGTISVDTTALTALQKKVADNTAAISGKQDAGNYITYEKRGLNEDRCYIIKPSYYIQCRTGEFDNGKYNYSTMDGQYINVVNSSGQNVEITSEGITISDQGDASNEYHLSLSDNNISSRSNSASHSLLFSLNRYGVKLESGSDNEVLTSNASTIDITKYVLKSVYDEKIAALEVRIAALEANHTETA